MVVHYVITGRVKKTRASGSIRAWRTFTGRDSDAPVITCKNRTHTWNTYYVKPPKRSTAPPTAFFKIAPIRAFEAGQWNYYIGVAISGCTNATSVKVSAPGAQSDLAPCPGQATLGPLTPKRTYRVTVKPNGKRAKAAPPSDVYLPGEDGVWETIGP